MSHNTHDAGPSLNEKFVGVLHDVVENTDWTFECLPAEGFPTHIVNPLRSVTKLSVDESYNHFIDCIKPNLLASAVKINDLTDNMDISPLYEINRFGCDFGTNTNDDILNNCNHALAFVGWHKR